MAKATVKVVTLDSLLNSALNPGFAGSEVLRQAMEHRAKERNEKAFTRATAALELGERAVASAVHDLRNARNAERRAKAAKDTVVRAVAYFGETGNYFPLVRLTKGATSAFTEMRELGLDVSKLDEVSLIPDGWEPKVAVEVNE